MGPVQFSAFFCLGPRFLRGTYCVFGHFLFRSFMAGGRRRRGRPSNKPPAAAAGYRQQAGLLSPACGAFSHFLFAKLLLSGRPESFLLLRRRGSAPCGSYAAQLGVLASRFARSNLLEQCSHQSASFGRLSLRGSLGRPLRSPLRTFALKSSALWLPRQHKVLSYQEFFFAFTPYSTPSSPDIL